MVCSYKQKKTKAKNIIHSANENIMYLPQHHATVCALSQETNRHLIGAYVPLTLIPFKWWFVNIKGECVFKTDSFFFFCFRNFAQCHVLQRPSRSYRSIHRVAHHAYERCWAPQHALHSHTPHASSERTIRHSTASGDAHVRSAIDESDRLEVHDAADRTEKRVYASAATTCLH